MKDSNIWNPVYKISPKVARALMNIAAVKTIVERTALPPAAEAELRRADRVQAKGSRSLFLPRWRKKVYDRKRNY